MGPVVDDDVEGAVLLGQAPQGVGVALVDAPRLDPPAGLGQEGHGVGGRPDQCVEIVIAPGVSIGFGHGVLESFVWPIDTCFLPRLSHQT